MRLALLAGVCLGAGAAQLSAQQPATRPAFKGIWEPVSYGEDVSLNGVYFVTAEEGWVTGANGIAGGILLHTRDGGQSWEVVLGDPEGNQREFYRLRFVDQATGFVVQGTGSGPHQLLRTTNGADWAVSGTIPEHHTDYRFISASEGVTSASGKILRTSDAGRTWKEVFECVLSVQDQGLTRKVGCFIDAFSFPSPSVGYAIGYSYDVPGLYFFRTQDGGASWTGALVVPGDEGGKEGHVFFITEQTGYICAQRGSLFGTTDGGATWTGLPGAKCELKADLLFADPEVGWAFHYNTLTYTVDRGRRWVSRQIALPAQVTALSLPRRDRAYVVGDHGMVYRYRVVPAETSVANALAGPLMPVIPVALATDVSRFEEQVTALEGAVESSAPAPGAGPPGAAAVGADSALSPFMNGCCGKRLSALELVLRAVGGIVPDFISKYQNLNLLAQGLRTATTLPEIADRLRTSFRSFRTATDRTAATAALNEVKTVLAGLKAAVDTAMQKPQ